MLDLRNRHLATLPPPLAGACRGGGGDGRGEMRSPPPGPRGTAVSPERSFVEGDALIEVTPDSPSLTLGGSLAISDAATAEHVLLEDPSPHLMVLTVRVIPSPDTRLGVRDMRVDGIA